MEWDLGMQGIGVLLAMSAAFGAVAHFVAARRTSHWIGPIVAAIYFVAGLFVSEVWFGWATEEDLQPNIDGLSFDEVLLLAMLPAIAAIMLARHMARRTGHRPR